jgi:pimeloyl-ACP methyl ester carboxylesterase
MILPASLLLRVVGLVVLIWLGVVVFVAMMQRGFIYFPSRASEPELLGAAGRIGLQPWRDSNGALIGWKTANDGAQNRIVVFHGNAGYALHRAYFAEGFTSLDAGKTWRVFIFEYPGYGARPGKAAKDSFMQAARSAIDELSRESPVWLLGESIGGGVATQLAGERPRQIAGLFLATPFSNLTDVGTHHFPWLPVRLLLRDNYDCQAALKDYRGPIAFLLAGRDEVIPAKFGQRLHEQYDGPKKLWLQPNATHNTVDYSPNAAWWREVSNFLLEARTSARVTP